MITEYWLIFLFLCERLRIPYIDCSLDMLLISLRGFKLFHCMFLKQKVRHFQIGLKREQSPKSTSANAYYMIIVLVAEFVLNKMFCVYYMILFPLLLGVGIPWLRNHQLKFIILRVPVCCVHTCAWFEGQQLERESSSTWQRDLGKMLSLFFIFVLLRVTHVPLSKQMYHNVLCLFFNVEWFSSRAKLLNINGMSTICQSTTKTSCNMEFCFECVSKGSLWGLVRGEVCVVCLLSELL